jgi:flagellin
MSVINTNITAKIAQGNLRSSQSSLSTAMERLSSGLRINSAKDDAAGQAIANRMSAQIGGLAQAQRNANDGISVAQTAEGALNQVNDNLQRVRELAVQAENGTNSPEDLRSIQDEVKLRMDEIDRISEQTDFNGTKVLANDTALKIQVGANDGETIDINLQEITSSTLSLQSFNLSGPQGAPTSASAADYQEAYGSTTGVTTSSVTDDSAALAGRLGVAGTSVVYDAADIYTDDNGNFFAEVTITAADATESGNLAARGFDIASGASETFYVAVDPDEADTSSGTSAVFDIDAANIELSSISKQRTDDPLAQIDSALGTVDSLRSGLGAVQNRLDSAIKNLSTNETNLSAARSRIEDADFATEVSNLTKAQILQQAGTSILSQANQLPQSALSLLG